VRQVGDVKRLAVASVLASLACLPRTARADDTPPPKGRTSSLSWIRLPGAESCVATQALARAVEERLARQVFVSAAQADVSVEGRIEPKEKGGFHAVLTIRDAKGELLGTREIDRPDASCDAMTHPVALVIAVMIDPLTPPSPPQDRKEREVVVERRDVIVQVPVPVAVEVEPEPPKFRFEGSAAATGAVGLLPNPAVGIGAFALLEPRAAIPFVGFGSYWLAPSADADAGKGAHTALSMVLFGGGFCPLWHHAKVAHLYACATGHLGMIFARSSGYALPPTDAPRVVWDAAVELRSTVLVVKPFVIRLGIQGIVPLLRPRYTYDRADGTQGEVFHTAPIAGMVDLGVGVVFP
jgi:hypothetical protein